MTRRHRSLIAAATLAAVAGVSLSLTLAGGFGPGVATGAGAASTGSVAPVSAAQIFGCRASVARLSLAGRTLLEPAVANQAAAAPDDTPCNDDSALVQRIGLTGTSSPLNLGSLGPAGAYTYQTGALGGSPSPGATAVADVQALNLTLGAYTLTVAGPLEAQAAMECVGTTLQTQGSSNLDVITLTGPGLPAGGETLEVGGVVNKIVGNLPAALSALVSITANEQITTSDSITERLLDVKLLDSAVQLVVGEATLTAPNPNVCAANVTPTSTVTVTTPGQTVTEPGSTVTQPGSTVTEPGSTVTEPGSTVTQPGSTTTVTTPGKPTVIVEPSGSVPGYLQQCATGSVIETSTGNCVIYFGGTVIFVSKPFKGPTGGTVVALPYAQAHYRSPCLTGPGPDWVLLVTARGAHAKGTPYSDRILGLNADQHIDGLAGNDCIDEQGPSGHLQDGNGKDRLYVSSGVNRVIAGNGDNVIHGGHGRNWITDGIGADHIYGGTRPNRIDAFANKKWIYGRSGHDRIWTNSAVAQIHCGGGRHDLVFARVGVARFAAKHGCRRIVRLR
jgi:hypothetical protein